MLSFCNALTAVSLVLAAVSLHAAAARPALGGGMRSLQQFTVETGTFRDEESRRVVARSGEPAREVRASLPHSKPSPASNPGPSSACGLSSHLLDFGF